MRIEINNTSIIRSVSVYEVITDDITNSQVDQLKSLIYKNKIVILKNQNLSPHQFLAFAKHLGMPEQYYQPMYHHPEVKEIFVSSNIPKNGVQVGVPKTGRFWHADYSFMPRPFAITLIYPQVMPTLNRGTYFIDMGRAYLNLQNSIKEKIIESNCIHSAMPYFKIRPSDLYRPLGEVMADVQRETPEVKHPCCFKHPITGEMILFVDGGLTIRIEDVNGNNLGAALLDELLVASGQRDKLFQHPLIHLQTYEPGDLLLWDNRSLVHCALHSDKPEPTESFRITVHDSKDFYEDISSYNVQRVQ